MSAVQSATSRSRSAALAAIARECSLANSQVCFAPHALFDSVCLTSESCSRLSESTRQRLVLAFEARRLAHLVASGSVAGDAPDESRDGSWHTRAALSVCLRAGAGHATPTTRAAGHCRRADAKRDGQARRGSK